MPATKRMWWEGELYYGVAGATATNKLVNVRDAQVQLEYDEGDTTVRGDGSAVPWETSRPTKRRLSITWTHIMKSDDTFLEAMRSAAHNASPVALRGKDHSAGKGPDGDFYLSCDHGKPYNGEQTLQFVAKPTDENRVFQGYV